MTPDSASAIESENQAQNNLKYDNSLLNRWIEHKQRKTHVQLGLAFQHLHVHGFSSSSQYQHTVISYLSLLPKFVASSLGHKAEEKVQILQDFNGVVQSGEMLLVLGRPGSGCSTFLKTLAGDTHGIFLGDKAAVNYQGISYEQMHNKFKGECIYLGELDSHFPELTVKETIGFVAATQERGRERDTVSREMGQTVASLFNLDGAMNTKIGDAMLRGVSGGEKRRVSIAEAFMSTSQIQCWDNSTRGLDSLTALDFIALLRSSTGTFRSTAVMSIYQASEAMYQHFDKVTLLYDGRQIYFGPASEAANYFIELGFVRPPRATTADFLTSLTHPAERIVREGYQNRVPRSPDEFASVWENSPGAAKLREEIEAFNSKSPVRDLSVKSRSTEDGQTLQLSQLRSTYPIPISLQIAGCVKRSFLRLKNNYPPVVANVVGNTILAIILGSIFFKLDESSAGLDKRAVLIFFATMMNALVPAFEVLTIWKQRPIVEKHNGYTFYHPFTESAAQMLTDLPNKIATSVFFNTVLYFMTNLRQSVKAFFTFYLTSIVLVLTMSMFFRAVGSLSRTLEQSMAPVSIMILFFVSYAGFVIPVGSMTPWLQWIRRLNPMAYAYESLMINEFNHREIYCSALIPSGPNYEQYGLQGKVCNAIGALPGRQTVQGEDYVRLKFSFLPGHLWRNFGILVAMMVILCTIHLLAAEFIPAQRSRGEILIFRKKHKQAKIASDEEKSAQVVFPKEVNLSHKLGQEIDSQESNKATEKSGRFSTTKHCAVFHWKDVDYDIKTSEGTRRILSDVAGYVKPGTLTALMGATGAGKTSLLDVLAGRASVGIVTGTISVGQNPRDESFQRKTGYVIQEDVHLATATVREALNFSALLRQSKERSTAEKLAYVDTVLDRLDMVSYAEAIVGVPGEGLNVEQRKRLSIAVEMVARPELLLFLDEPTSGLDSQTAWSICMLLRKLADNGQAILCTIHQPSSQIFQIFDRLLLLEKGGRTLYFGDIGLNASEIIQYFTSNGAPDCGDQNPAEWVLNVTGGLPSTKRQLQCSTTEQKDWGTIWTESPERRDLDHHLTSIHSPNTTTPTISTTNTPKDEYATPPLTQFLTVTHRIFQEYWRDPVYIYSKVALSAGVALCTGLSFLSTPSTIQGITNTFFSGFLLTQIFSCEDQQVIPRLINSRTLFEARERRSKTYSWPVWVGSNVLVEMVWQTLTAVLVFVAWYFPIGLWRNGDTSFSAAERAGLTLVILWLFCLFVSTFSQAVAVGMEHAETAVQIATLLFYLCIIFCGVIIQPGHLPGFWMFMYRVSPLTYFIAGLVTAGLAGSEVSCSGTEMLRVSLPEVRGCAEYMGEYMKMAGGYVRDVGSECFYCPIPVGKTDMLFKGFGIDVANKWRNAGYLVVYVVVNVSATFAIYWVARVPKGKKRLLRK